MHDTQFVLLIIPTGWVNKQKNGLWVSGVVAYNLITYSVKLTSYRKLDVAHDKRKAVNNYLWWKLLTYLLFLLVRLLNLD